VETITLKYGSTTKVYNALSVRGFEVDEVRLWPPVQQKLADGSLRHKVSSLARTFTVSLAPVSAKADRAWLVTFALSNDWSLIYGGEEVEVVWGDPVNAIRSDWLDGTENSRAYTLTFLEKTAFPIETLPLTWQ
jgi:hypothetical protein